MSVEAITYEEMTFTVNETTKELTEAVISYLKNLWGVNKLELDIDDRSYICTEYETKENSEVYSAIDTIINAEQVSFKLSVNDNGGFNYKEEESFIRYFTDETKQFVDYKCIEYYDTDDDVFMFSFGKNGRKHHDYTKKREDIADISKWYSFGFNVLIEDDDFEEHPEFHDVLIDCLKSIYDIPDDADEEDYFDDEYEDSGYLETTQSLSISAERLDGIIESLNMLLNECNKYDIEVELYFAAVPDGENDYNFASIEFSVENELVVAKFARF